MSDNDEVRSKGFSALVQALQTNARLLTLRATPSGKYRRYLDQVDDLLRVNAAIATLRKVDTRCVYLPTYLPAYLPTELTDLSLSLTIQDVRLLDFAALSETGRANLILKLQSLSEAELAALVANNQQPLEDAPLSAAANVSGMRHFATMAMYSELRRLLYVLDTRERLVDRQQRVQNQATAQGDDDDDDQDVWDYPLC